jgi:TPR repeat protein
MQAAFWYRKAADQGDAPAQRGLGNLYDDGHGVPQDHTQAAVWWRKAAEQGDAIAQVALGLSYALGQGVPQDYAEAYFWLDLAASGKLEYGKPEDAAKLPDVSKIRDDTASHLTSTVLLQTQERARKWFEDHAAKTPPQ